MYRGVRTLVYRRKLGTYLASSNFLTDEILTLSCSFLLLHAGIFIRECFHFDCALDCVSGQRSSNSGYNCCKLYYCM